MNFTKITLTIFSLLTLAAASPAFANVNNDMQKCAVAALDKSDFASIPINVNNSPKYLSQMDHDFSGFSTEYRMTVVNSKSGLDLGEVSCKLDKTGEITSVQFLTKS